MITDPLYLPPVETHLTHEQAMHALLGGHRLVQNSTPSPECLAVLFAQCVLETGHFEHMKCFNFGNVKRIPGEHWTAFRCNEKIGGVYKWFDPPHAQTHFAAHRSAREGAAKHLEFLICRERYRDAWRQAYAGRPEQFSKALSKAGYYTADEGPYTAAVVKLFNAALPATRAMLLPGEILSGVEREALLALCAVTAVETLRGSRRNDVLRSEGVIA